MVEDTLMLNQGAMVLHNHHPRRRSKVPPWNEMLSCSTYTEDV